MTRSCVGSRLDGAFEPPSGHVVRVCRCVQCITLGGGRVLAAFREHLSTDVGGGELCPGLGDDGALQIGEASCNTINDGKRFISDIANEDGSRTANYDGQLGDAVALVGRTRRVKINESAIGLVVPFLAGSAQSRL